MTTVPGVCGVVGLRVPGAVTYRHLAIRLVSTACKMALEAEPGGEDSDFEAEVVSAFGEAFNNIAIHAYRGRNPEPVQIEVDWDDEKLVVTVVDTGNVFDPEAVAPLDLNQLHERGMGLHIMRSCMDRVEYHPGPPNVLRLVKLRARRGGLLPPLAGSGSTPEVSAKHAPPSPSEPFRGGAARDPSHPTPMESSPGDTSPAPWHDRDSGVEVVEPTRTRGPGAYDRVVESSRRR